MLPDGGHGVQMLHILGMQAESLLQHRHKSGFHLRFQRIAVLRRLLEPLAHLFRVGFDAVRESASAIVRWLSNPVVSHFLHERDDGTAAILLGHSHIVIRCQQSSAHLHHRLFLFLQTLMDDGAILVYLADVGDFLSDFLAVNEVILLEDIASELLHRLVHLPRAVGSDFLLYEVNDGLELAGVLPQRLDDSVNGIRQHLRLIQFHFQVGRQFQFVGKFTNDTLKERVYRLNAKTAIIMHNVRQRLLRPLAQDVPVDAQNGGAVRLFSIQGHRQTGMQIVQNILYIIIGTFQSIGYTIKCAENPLLHLRSRLVGEGDGKNVLILHRIDSQQRDVFNG